jgi:hypothetical protein
MPNSGAKRLNRGVEIEGRGMWHVLGTEEVRETLVRKSEGKTKWENLSLD